MTPTLWIVVGLAVAVFLWRIAAPRTEQERRGAQTETVLRQVEIRSLPRKPPPSVLPAARGVEADPGSEADAYAVPPKAPVVIWYGAVIPGGKRRKQVTH